ncbi:MAG TPA: hypothetical protein VH912_05255 [Streptosporangiaceae bacterium]
MHTAVRAVMEQRYGELIRIAYLTLDDGRTRPGALLATARKVVQEAAERSWAAPEPGRTYAELRCAVAGCLVAGPAMISRFRLRRTAGPSAQNGPTLAALRQFSPHERLVYVLVRIEGLTPDDVADELARCLVVTAADVTRTLADADAATGLDPGDQTAELRAFDPTVVRLRPPPGRPRRRRLVVAAVLGVVVAAVAVGYPVWRQAPRPDDPILVKPDLWRRERTPDVTVWPTQGGRKWDLALLRRARDSWLRDARTPPVGRLYVMYAGDLGDATTVIMRDSPGERTAPLVAQYVERPLSRGVESVRQLGIGSYDLILIDALSNRFLVPPWRTNLRASPLDIPHPRWRDLPVRDGVTAPLPWSWFDVRCQFYVAFQVADRESYPPQTITMLASHVSASATPQVTFRVPGPVRYDDTALDNSARWDGVRALACAGGAALQESADLRVGELWRGSLPDHAGPARIFTVERSGGSADQGDQALLIDGKGRPLGYGDSNSDHVLWADELAAAVWWWRAPTRRWYLVVAAAKDVPRYYVLGELGRHEPRGRSLILSGPRSGPDADKRPVVEVVVDEPDGDHSVITP